MFSVPRTGVEKGGVTCAIGGNGGKALMRRKISPHAAKMAHHLIEMASKMTDIFLIVCRRVGGHREVIIVKHPLFRV